MNFTSKIEVSSTAFDGSTIAVIAYAAIDNTVIYDQVTQVKIYSNEQLESLKGLLTHHTEEIIKEVSKLRLK